MVRHWTPKQLREWQDQDEAITTVRQWKIDKIERPPWSEVSAGGRELKALWSQWALLEARENLLYRKYNDLAGQKFRLEAGS